MEVILRNPAHLWRVTSEPGFPRYGELAEADLEEMRLRCQRTLSGQEKGVKGQDLARLLTWHEEDWKYTKAKAAQGKPRFKVEARGHQRVLAWLAQARRNLDDQVDERAKTGAVLEVTMRLIDALSLNRADVEYVMGLAIQFPEGGPGLTSRLGEGEEEELKAVHRLGVRYAGTLQSSVPAMLSRQQHGHERAVLLLDERSGILLGYARWWGLSEGGVRRVLSGAIQVGRDLKREDRCEIHVDPKGEDYRFRLGDASGGLYLAMIAGETTEARRAVMRHARVFADSARRRGRHLFAKPNTADGHRVLRNPHYDFRPIEGTEIWARHPTACTAEECRL